MFIFKFFRRLVAFLLLLIIIFPLWGLSRTWYSAHNPTLRNADAILVMGAAQLDGKPGEILSARLEETLRIYLLKRAPIIITVGASAPGDRTTEAATGKEWLRSNKVAKAFIISIPIGRDSFTSIKALEDKVSKKKIHDIIIVTDPYHCLRVTTIANDQGFSATCSPVRTGPATVEKAGFRYLFRETQAYLAYITLGRRGIHISDRS